MSVEKYCKFKKRAVVLNECSAMCVCASCTNDACMTRRDDGVNYTYSTCQEYIATKIDPEYKFNKARTCRICLSISNQIQNSK